MTHSARGNGERSLISCSQGECLITRPIKAVLREESLAPICTVCRNVLICFSEGVCVGGEGGGEVRGEAGFDP